MQTIGGMKPSSFEDMPNCEAPPQERAITRILTKSTKNFKQNPAKFKLPSDEEQRKETDDGLKTDEDL